MKKAEFQELFGKEYLLRKSLHISLLSKSFMEDEYSQGIIVLPYEFGISLIP